MRVRRASLSVWLGERVSRAIDRLLAWLGHRRASRRARVEPRIRPPEHADERTIRRIAEAQGGGISSRESAARYQTGENPGGLHHHAVRREGPERMRPEFEEPQERQERGSGDERHIPVKRRG